MGLLTQLLNPNPEISQVGHPHRRENSSSGIRGVGGRASVSRGDRDKGFTQLQPLMDVKGTKTDNIQDNKLDTRPPPSRLEATVYRKSSSSSVHSQAAAAFSPPARALSMQRTESAVAMPVSSQVQTGGVIHTRYRPKGRPQDQELEDESGSEAELGIQVSKSIAQEKLKALAERRGFVTHENQSTATTNHGADTKQKDPSQLGDEDDVPHWANLKVSKPQPTWTRSHDQNPQPQAPDPNAANHRSINAFHFSQMITSTSSHATPIPVPHPYNLSPPAPPSTPRTIRRLMLSTELSESLRQNLLWERQVNKVNLAAAVRRSASSGGSRLSQLGGVQPLTTRTAPSMVQLLPKGTMAYPNPGSPVRPVRPEQESSDFDSSNMESPQKASGGAGGHPGPSVLDDKEKEQNRKLAMARNRGWANDYHVAGW